MKLIDMYEARWGREPCEFTVAEAVKRVLEKDADDQIDRLADQCEANREYLATLTTLLFDKNVLTKGDVLSLLPGYKEID